MDPMPCKSFHQKEGVAHKPRIKMNNKKIAEKYGTGYSLYLVSLFAAACIIQRDNVQDGNERIPGLNLGWM